MTVLGGEWPTKRAVHFHLLTLSEQTSRKQMVRIVNERDRTERAYPDLKGELVLDYFEGRTFPGWHHHLSVVLCCFAFVVAEKLRTFFSTFRRQRGARPLPFEAGELLRALLNHSTSSDCAHAERLAAALPVSSYTQLNDAELTPNSHPQAMAQLY